MQRMFRRFLITGFLALIGSAAGYHAHAQVNPFNPDYAWCNVRGSVAIRGAAAWQCLLPGTAGQVLQSGGAGANPSWLTVSGAGTVTSVGLTVPSFMTVGNSPITAAGNIALGFASGTANRVLATPNGAAGVPTFRALVEADLPAAGVLDGLVKGPMSATYIRAQAVSNAMLEQMPAYTIKANATGAASIPQNTTMSAMIDAAYSASTGDLLYRSAAGWNVLSPGIANTYLRSNGVGADLSWNDPTGGTAPGTVTSVTCNSGLTGGTITTVGTCALNYSAITNAIPGLKTNTATPAGNIGETKYDGGTQATATTSAFTLATITMTPGYYILSGEIRYQNLTSATGTIKDLYCEWTPTSTRIPDGRSLPGFNILNASAINVTNTGPDYTYPIPSIDLSNTTAGNTNYYLRCIANTYTGDVRVKASFTRIRYK